MISDIQRRSIVLFGDSLTQRGWGGETAAGVQGAGWASLIAAAYSRKADVLNRGFGGYTTRSGAAIADRVFPSGAPKLLFSTVFFGANDVARDAPQHVPLRDYETFLGAIVAAAAAVSDTVLIISPPPVDELQWPDRSCARLREYAAAAARVAAAAGASHADARVVHVDLAPAFALRGAAAEAAGAAAPGWLPLLSDGLHLTPAGQAVVAEAVLAALFAAAPGSAPDSLAWDFPHWAKLPGDDAGVAAVLAPAAVAAMRAAPPLPMPNLICPAPQPPRAPESEQS